MLFNNLSVLLSLGILLKVNFHTLLDFIRLNINNLWTIYNYSLGLI